jgi:predicted Zn-dependent protease
MKAATTKAGAAPAAQPGPRALTRAVGQALEQAEGLLGTQPDAALAQAEAVLLQMPGLPPAEMIACQALRKLGQPGAALPRLAALARSQPRVPSLIWELAQAASEAGDRPQAIAALENLTRQQPAVASGWFMLAAELRGDGRGEEAWRADIAGVHAASRDPELLKAASDMNSGALDESAAVLTARLARMPGDPVGTRLLGEVQWRRGDMNEALALVARALELAPGFDTAREFLVRLLLQVNRLPDALEHAEMLASSTAGIAGHDLLKASVLVRLGDQERARAIYERLLGAQPDQPLVWQNLGHVLKTLGAQDEAIAAYREAATRNPAMGEAWWSLANLKTVKLGPEDITRMTAALAALDRGDGGGDGARREDVFHLHFSLGKAYEDAKDYSASFAHYEQGNRLRRALVHYDPDQFSAEVTATAQTFSAAFLAGMGDGGCAASDPIFIVGLPRSGSTLVEQILSSHSQIEGTMELAEMMMIASRLQSRVDDGEFADFAAMAASLTPDHRRQLGEEYLERTRVHRQSDKPRFIDKMPNNWQHIGLIKLILPNAAIIDARRHPLGCCFSAWKQHFARGQVFTYDLADVGRYYAEYVALMAGFDRAAPGAVHQVIYEQMVADTPGEVNRLLAHLGLPFEDACLAFWETKRSVRTASSEQVRQPIFTGAVEHWKNYAPWLGPLEAALGDVAQHYPALPPSLA